MTRVEGASQLWSHALLGTPAAPASSLVGVNYALYARGPMAFHVQAGAHDSSCAPLFPLLLFMQQALHC